MPGFPLIGPSAGLAKLVLATNARLGELQACLQGGQALLERKKCDSTTTKTHLHHGGQPLVTHDFS